MLDSMLTATAVLGGAAVLAILELQAEASLPQQDLPSLESQQLLPSLEARILASWFLQHSMAALPSAVCPLQQDISPDDLPLQHDIAEWLCFSSEALPGVAESFEQQEHMDLASGFAFSVAAPGAGDGDGVEPGCCAASGSQATRANTRITANIRNFINFSFKSMGNRV